MLKRGGVCSAAQSQRLRVTGVKKHYERGVTDRCAPKTQQEIVRRLLGFPLLLFKVTTEWSEKTLNCSAHRRILKTQMTRFIAQPCHHCRLPRTLQSVSISHIFLCHHFLCSLEI